VAPQASLSPVNSSSEASASGIESSSPPHGAGTANNDPLRLRRLAWRDLVDGASLWDLWGRLCWNEVRRRYRRTLLGPMWVTVSLGIFSLVLSFVWSAIFKLNVREYLPFLLSGLIPWMMIASSVGESCTSLLGAEAIMKSRQFPYSILVHVVVARNAVIFAH